MITQIINLSDYEYFKIYSNKYGIYREVYSNGLLGLEMRNIKSKLGEEIKKLILRENEICYKYADVLNGTIHLFITGSISLFKDITNKILSKWDEELGYNIYNIINNYEHYGHQRYAIGDKLFNFEKSYVMGILNITTDSFSDGGMFLDKSAAVKYGIQMIEEGSDILDIGGESTRPNAEPVDQEEEIKRIIPVIKDILAIKKDAIISVDTTKSVVAEEALRSGAKIINDISGLTFDPNMQAVIKKYEASVIIMHMKGDPKTMQTNPAYDNIIVEIFDFLFRQTQKALKMGIKNIFVDPGIGFGKTIDHNFEIIKRLDNFKCLGFPLVFGASRKSFIGKTLNLDPLERDTASAIVNTVSINNGARIIRTHNVKYGVQTVNLMNKIC